MRSRKGNILLFLICLMALGTSARTHVLAQEPAVVSNPLDSLSMPIPDVDSLVSFARKYIGVPYRYGGCTPEGFDCSGFVNFVFSKMGMSLPRSSPELGRVGTDVPLSEARKGDIILFGGSDPKKRPIGHAGIIVSNPGEPLRFIHSQTSNRIGIIVSALDGYDYFVKRFVKVVRVIGE